MLEEHVDLICKVTGSQTKHNLIETKIEVKITDRILLKYFTQLKGLNV